MEQGNLKILFFGDITGRQGRNAVKSFLASNSNEDTFVIANIENASHGFGLTKKNYNELLDAGIDCFTSGNHIWDKKDVYEYKIKDGLPDYYFFENDVLRMKTIYFESDSYITTFYFDNNLYPLLKLN